MATSTTPPRPHLGYVDGLRALAALYVLLYHAHRQFWIATVTPLPAPLVWAVVRWLTYGHLAVSAFIVISGFCLMLPVVRGEGTLRGGALIFFGRRAKRILPPYYFAMGLALLLLATGLDPLIKATPRAILVHLLLLQDLDKADNLTIVGAFWSVAVEWKIYFFFPTLVWLARRASVVATTLGTLAASFVLYFALRPTWLGELPGYGDYAFAPQYLGLFAIGMLGAAIAFSPRPAYAALRRRVPWSLVSLTLLAAIVLFCAYIYGAHHETKLQFAAEFLTLDLLVGLLTLALLVGGALPGAAARNPIRAIFGWRPLAFVGAFSYSLYLIHRPLIDIALRDVVYPLRASTLIGLDPKVVNFGVFLLLGLPLIVGAAYLFHLVCERPFMNTRAAARSGWLAAWRRRFARRPRPLAPAPAQRATESSL